jgi:hypothetical protein
VLTAPEDFIAKAKMHKVFIITLNTTQMTQATSLPKVKPKIIFDIGCDHQTPSMATILSIHALHLGGVVCIWKQWR